MPRRVPVKRKTLRGAFQDGGSTQEGAGFCSTPFRVPVLSCFFSFSRCCLMASLKRMVRICTPTCAINMMPMNPILLRVHFTRGEQETKRAPLSWARDCGPQHALVPMAIPLPRAHLPEEVREHRKAINLALHLKLPERDDHRCNENGRQKYQAWRGEGKDNDTREAEASMSVAPRAAL